tara:strand:+ start:1293 stop:2426 length:1134 start_codon:yes stop_codon:yes gene_type:complete
MYAKLNYAARQSLIREKHKETAVSKLLYNGRDVTPLLLADPDSLDKSDIATIRGCYTEYGRSYIVTLVTAAKIIPFASFVFIVIDCDKDFWKPKYDVYIKRNTAVKKMLNGIFLRLKDYPCKSLTLTENFAVVLTTDISIGCFCSGDVDLSADFNEKEAITACLNSLNFFSEEQPDKIGEYSGQSMMFHNKNIIQGGFWVNVIWRPVTRAFLVQDSYVTRLSRDRLEAKLIPNSAIRVLNDTSLMYFCALHIAAGHYFTLSPGIRLYVDIDRLARNKKIDWDKIMDWSEEDNAGIRISMVMCISNKVLKTPIPKKVYDHVLINRRNRKLLNYLVNPKSFKLQNKSNKLRRLYVELASDDKNLIFNFLNRVIKRIIFQ